MLHRIAAGRRNIVGEERIAAGFEPRKLAEHRHHLTHDTFDIPGVARKLGLGTLMMDRDAKRRRVGGIGRVRDDERTIRERAELDGTVEQV